MTYILELNHVQLGPLLVAALKEAIIDQQAWGEADEKLLAALCRVLRYYTTEVEYNEVLLQVKQSIAEQNKE